MSTGKDEVFVSDENHGMTAYTFADRVKKRVADLGIGNYERPRLEKDHESLFPRLKRGDYFDGRLPSVIRKLTLDQLSALYSLFMNWYGYVAMQFMVIATERSEAMCQRDFLLTNIRNYYRVPDPDGKKPPETAITDAAKQDKRYVLANAKAEELDCLYNQVLVTRGIASQNMKVISREVTIQQEKLQKELMLQGFGNRAKRESNFAHAVEGDDSYGETPENLADAEGDEDGLESPAPATAASPRSQIRVPRVHRR
jgi:hypothetical protein